MKRDKYILPILTFCLVLFNFTKLVQVFFNSTLLSTLFVSVLPTLLVGILAFRYFIIPKNNIDNYVKNLDSFVFLYLAISFLSVLLYFQKGNPASISAFSYGVFYGILPVIYFFAVRRISTNDKDKLIKRIIYLNILLLTFGLVVYLLRPGFYTSYLSNESSRQHLELWQIYGRLQSYFGSTAVGTMGLISFTLMPRVKVSRLLKLLLYIIIVLSTILTQQRSAIILLIILLLNLIWRSIKNKTNAILFLVLLPLIIIFIANMINIQIKETQGVDLIEYTYVNRVENLDIVEMFQARSGYSKGFQFFQRYPFGLGLGATMSASENAGFHYNGQVVDANYMRILADTGFLGLFSMLLIIFYSLKKSFSRDREIFYILVIYSLQALGTNLFETFYSVHLFWIFLGLFGSRSVMDSTRPIKIRI